MKKFLSLIVFCLMVPSFTQIVYGWGETEKVSSTTTQLPPGWVVKKNDGDQCEIVNLDNAPYGVTIDIQNIDNLPSGWTVLNSNSGKYTVKCSIPDTTPPSAPENLLCTPTGNSVTLSWLASKDRIGVTGYTIYNGSIQIGSTEKTSYIVNNLKQNIQYEFKVKAKDAENNYSDPSMVRVTIPLK